MRRRDFFTFAGGATSAALLRPVVAYAQQSRRIGVITTAGTTDQEMRVNVAAFEQVLRSLRWKIGEDLRIDYRWAAGDAQAARNHAGELVAAAPSVIVVGSTFVLSAVQEHTRTIPIVFNGVSDPVAQGFVANLTHPGGNITGFSSYEFAIGGKWLDLLKQFSPNLKRVALLANPVTSPQFKYNLASIEAAGPAFGVEVVGAPIADLPGIESAIAALGAGQGGMIVANDNFIRGRHLADVLELAARHRVPAIYSQRPYVDAGGLMRYGTNNVEGWRGTAFYVDRILKGTKPGDLPIQQPIKYELVINLKTAHALGLELPMGLMMRADEVIE